MKQQMTFEDLVAVLRESAGEGEGVDLGAQAAGMTFTDLGYDSLALLETAGRVQRDYGVDLDDEVLNNAETPEMFLRAVNEAIAANG